MKTLDEIPLVTPDVLDSLVIVCVDLLANATQLLKWSSQSMLSSESPSLHYKNFFFKSIIAFHLNMANSTLIILNTSILYYRTKTSSHSLIFLGGTRIFSVLRNVVSNVTSTLLSIQPFDHSVEILKQQDK